MEGQMDSRPSAHGGQPYTARAQQAKSRPMFVNLKNRLHLPGVNELLAPCTAHLTPAQYKRMLGAWQQMPRYHVYGFVQYGRAIALVAMEEKVTGAARVLALSVLPQHRGRGLGRRMVIESFCTMDLATLSADTLAEMTGFYEKVLFEIGPPREGSSGLWVYPCLLRRETLHAAYQHEYSAGAVLYGETREGRVYVLVTELSGNTGLPKGHVEAGETQEQTALREIREETGLHADILPGFGGEIVYPQGKGMLKHFTYFLATFTGDQQPVSGSDVVVHVLPYDQALRKLSFADVRGILRDAEIFLNMGQ